MSDTLLEESAEFYTNEDEEFNELLRKAFDLEKIKTKNKWKWKRTQQEPIPLMEKPQEEELEVKAWYKQKQLQKKDIPSPEQIKQICAQIVDLRIRSLFIVLYLTAARVNEIVKSLRKKDIQFITIDNRPVVVFTLKNEKNKKKKIKKIPIPLDRDLEKELVAMLKVYLDTLERNEFLFDFSHIRAYQLLTKFFNINPHFIRHIRLTHLVTDYDFNEQLLVLYAGWTDSRPAKNYMQFKWQDLLKKM